jgi:hypothetical protein
MERISLSGKIDGWNPLSLAVVKGNSNLVSMLLDRGANIGIGFNHNGHEYTPLMLAAQFFDPRQKNGNVIQVLLKHFGSKDYGREIKMSFIFNQPELRRQLETLHEQLFVRSGSECLEDGNERFSDLKAESYRAMDITCAVCLEVPGGSDKATLLSGAVHSGDSARCRNCGGAFCKSCLTASLRTKEACPLCRASIVKSNYSTAVETIHNAVPEFTQWVGAKVPLPNFIVKDETAPPLPFVPQYQNRSLTPLVEDHEDKRVRDLYALLRESNPEFFSMGGREGQFRVVVDPLKKVRPFLLSGEAPRKSDGSQYKHYEAAGGRDPETGSDHEGYCRSIGQSLMTKDEEAALERARKQDEDYSMPELEDSPVWSSSVSEFDRGKAAYFSGKTGLRFVSRNILAAVRCVSVAPGW